MWMTRGDTSNVKASMGAAPLMSQMESLSYNPHAVGGALVMFDIFKRVLRDQLTAFVAHYHEERNHQGLDNRLIAPDWLPPPGANGPVRCRARLGGLLHYYYRAA